MRVVAGQSDGLSRVGQFWENGMWAHLAKPVAGVIGVRFLAMHDAVPVGAFRSLDGLRNLMGLIDTGEVKVQAADGGFRRMGMREQGRRGGRLNLRQRLGRRATARSQRHEAFAIAVERQNHGD